MMEKRFTLTMSLVLLAPSMVTTATCTGPAQTMTGGEIGCFCFHLRSPSQDHASCSFFLIVSNDVLFKYLKQKKGQNCV